MSKKTDALKKLAVALGYGSAVSEYTGTTVTYVLKEIAVKMQCAPSVDNIRETGIVGILNYIADNYDTEEKEPYDLTVTKTHATVTVKRKGKTISPASDILYNGDKLTITAEADEGYELTTFTVNGEDIDSGDTVTVDGHHIAIIATAEATPEPEPENESPEA